jgi:hypothetical protein
MIRTSTLTVLRPPTGSTSDGAQQFDLRRHRQLADLVEEQRAAGGFDEFAEVLLGRAGEGALLVAEQDRLDEIVGNGAAIDRDERL